MAIERMSESALRQFDATLESETSTWIIEPFIFQLYVSASREARMEAARTVAQSRALRAEAQQIVERSRAASIQLRASEVWKRTAELPSPRKMRSLYVQAQHEYQRFLGLATELTEVIEHCAETVACSARYRAGTD